MYQEFAGIYDEFSQESFYDNWVKLLNPFLSSSKSILDLGCGSGLLLKKLASSGIDLTGVDISNDMLSVAQNNLQSIHAYINLYQQDMVEFFIPNVQYDIIVSTCDSINYIDELNKIDTMFAHINEMLSDKGIFIFDMHSDYTFEMRFNDWSYADASLNTSVLWNVFSEDNFLYEHNLTFFVLRVDGTYHRIDEVHAQYFYKKEQILQLLQKNNLTLIKVCSDFSDEFHSDGERTFYIVRKKDN